LANDIFPVGAVLPIPLTVAVRFEVICVTDAFVPDTVSEALVEELPA
jgi:hypothetical protein